MATTQISSFAQTGGLFLPVNPVSSRAVLPTGGTPTIALVSNLGDRPAFVALGDGTVVASNASLAVMPGDQISLTIGTATNIAVVTLAGVVGLNIAVGN
jgi:hypothetical protein